MFSSFKEKVYFLLVDDLEENLLSLEMLLRRDGLELLKARSGTEALELLLQYDVALALLDVQMPGMDGFELAELMRGTERTRSVPIIFLTAGTGDARRRFRGYEAGAVDFLQKPIEPDILRSKANVFFDLRRQHRLLEIQRDELLVRSEALKEADKRKDEYIATLAHELRNPLSPIKVSIQLLRNATPEKAAEIVTIIERQTDHLVRLVDDLLDVSRFAQGKIDLQREVMSLQSSVQAAIESVQPLLNAKGHALVVDLPPETVWVDADFTRLTQIISNLLNNAAKYTPDGGKISVRATVAGSHFTLSVTDNGLGIPAEMQSKIFDVFSQINNQDHLRKGQGGLGIGLSLVKNLIDLHGGTIRVHSEGINQGSTFTVEMPVAEAPAQTAPDKDAGTDAAVPAPATGTGSGYKVLVVDDNVAAAQTIYWMLEALDQQPYLAHSGQEALALADDIKPDIILLDIGLPDMSGYDVCQALRQNPLHQHALIIAQTGWGQEKDRKAAFQAGFDHHMVKPIGMKDFQDVFAIEKERQSGAPARAFLLKG